MKISKEINSKSKKQKIQYNLKFMLFCGEEKRDAENHKLKYRKTPHSILFFILNKTISPSFVVDNVESQSSGMLQP